MPLTVVVIDDSEEYRLIVRGLLRSVHDVTTFVGDAKNGADGLALVRRERPDMVITDLVLPGLDGVELTRRIRLELPRTKVILMSSYIEDAYRLMPSDSGADATRCCQRSAMSYVGKRRRSTKRPRGCSG